MDKTTDKPNLARRNFLKKGAALASNGVMPGSLRVVASAMNAGIPAVEPYLSKNEGWWNEDWSWKKEPIAQFLSSAFGRDYVTEEDSWNLTLRSMDNYDIVSKETNETYLFLKKHIPTSFRYSLMNLDYKERDQEEYDNLANLFLKHSPRAEDVLPYVKNIQRKAPYSFKNTFRDVSPEELASKLVEAMQGGEPAIRGLLEKRLERIMKYREMEIEELHKHPELEKVVRQQLEAQNCFLLSPTFTDMAAARKAGGYPIPVKRAEKAPKTGKHMESGEWRERIDASRDKPFPRIL